jgi:hypothetical protein
VPIPSLAYAPPPAPGEPPWRPAATWYAANGDTIVLTDCPHGIDWQAGRAGFDMPTYELTADPLLGGDGDTLRGVRAQARDLLVPLLIHNSTSIEEFNALRRRLARALNPDPGNGGGPGRLAIAQPDGEVRYLDCAYAGGAEGTDVRDTKGVWWRKYALTLRAHDPFWVGAPQPARRWNAPAPVPYFPLLPLRLRPSLVLGEGQVLTVAGDVRTWPRWTVRGPFEGIATLRHQGLGQEWSLDLDLADGDTRVVDTTPGQAYVRDGAGVSKWGELAFGSELWPLLAGPNVIDMIMTGAETGAYVELSTYDPRYLVE